MSLKREPKGKASIKPITETAFSATQIGWLGKEVTMVEWPTLYHTRSYSLRKPGILPQATQDTLAVG